MPERHRILIVDDDPRDRRAVALALSREAAEIDGVEADVREAETVAGAREALRREEFACIFLDHSLPDGTALDLLMELRTQGLATPVVVLTGGRDERAAVEVMRAGAADYLPKERLHPDLVARTLRASLRFLQAQRDTRAAVDELRARDRAIGAASNGIVLADPRRPDCPLVYTNAAFLAMTGYTEAEVIGRNCRFLQGPDTDPAAVRELREAIRQERASQTLILNYRKDGTAFWNEVTVSPVRDARGALTHFVGIQTDVTPRQVEDARRAQAEEALRLRAERERFLADLAERAQRLTDPDSVIADAVHSVGRFLGVSRCIFADIDIEADTCTIRPDYRADDTVASIEGVVPISAFGPFVVAEYAARRPVAVDDVRADPVKAPPETVAAYEAIGILAHVTVPVVHSGRVVSCISVHNSAPRQWRPEEVELLRTVVERTWLTVEVTRQQHALVREAEERREAHERTARILESLTDAFFALDVGWRFTYVNTQAERLLARTRGELLGRDVWEMFPDAVDSPFERHYRRAMGDGVPVTFEAFFPPLDTWFEVRAYPTEGGLSIFFQNVSARKAMEAERERLLGEQRDRAEREALLNRIGQALRGSAEPGQVLETAVRELGRALRADRCYYAAYDQEADTATVGPDWCRDGLPPLAGQYEMSRFVLNRDPVYQAGNTQAVADTAGDAAAQALGLRALVRVPLASGATMTALSVAMASGPRDWTPAEVSLVEAVATQTQSALEAVRMQRREHNIAEQLQAALQPPLPGGVPGLKLAKYYEAALEEAGVGGDFYDVFALEKGCTVLAVGDLSGKGLRAAAEVSTVRNMLRAFLYSKPTLAEAVTDLNRVLALNGLLSGFATLWVGCYDGSTGELTYVNLGQEPAILRRAATGEMEQLGPTGPILGAMENACYVEKVIPLSEGDALAVFSDGATECGVSRREMVGIEGVMALLGPPLTPAEAEDAQGMAETLTLRLVEGIDAASQGGLAKDDVCILVAVAEGGPAGAGRS